MGKIPEKNFKFTSDTNKDWLDKEQLKDLINEVAKTL